MIGFSVNGKRVDLDGDASTPLLWVIRENLGLTGTKMDAAWRHVFFQSRALRKAHSPVADADDGGCMKRVDVSTRFLLASLIIAAIALAVRFSPAVAAEPPAAKPASTVDAGDGALFTAFVPVLRHPRCMNCHSKGDFPRQGDDSHPHAMNVRRGPEGHGVTAEKCSTCHQDHNLDGAHLPPGAPHWGLPPANMPMIWQGLNDEQLCQSIKDPKQNRGRNLDQLVEHLTEDKLVMWGWNPGEGRNPVPMPHDEFAAKVKQWRAAGAPCPAQ